MRNVKANIGIVIGFLLLQTSCTGLQQSPIAANSEYLEFVAITPGTSSEFDQLFALSGDYTSHSLAIQVQHVPTAIAHVPEKASSNQRLRIFHINDLHHHLSDKVGELTEYRAARISKLIQDARQSSPQDESILFISAGDDAAGTSFDDLIGYDSNEFITHPGYETYSTIGMDVSVLGNHEFDWGTDLLELSITQSAAFPVISSNVWSAGASWPVHGSLIGTINGYRIAFLGFTPPDALPVQSLQAQGYKVLEISTQLEKLIPVLDPYVDFYILVNHIGYYADVSIGDIAVARQISELTAKPAIVVGGHTHTVLNKDSLQPANLINDIPILQAGAFGQWLGDASVTLTRAGQRVAASYSAQLIPIDANSGQDSVSELIDTRLQEETLHPMENRLLEKFNTVIADAIGDPDLSPEDTAIDRYSAESGMLNILTDALISNSSDWHEGRLDFAAINATSVSGGLHSEAEVTYGDVFGLMPYADTVFLLNVSGQELKEIIENNAARIRQRDEFNQFGGQLDPNQFQGRGFLQFSAGIRYAITRSPVTGLPEAQDILINAVPVDEVLSQQFTLAIPRYVATGRGSWAGESLQVGESLSFAAIDMRELVEKAGYDTGRVWRNELLGYFKSHGRNFGAEAGAHKDRRVQVTN